MTRVDASHMPGQQPPDQPVSIDPTGGVSRPGESARRTNPAPTARAAGQAVAVWTPFGSTGSDRAVKPTVAGSTGGTPSAVSASTVGPAPEIAAGIPRA